MQSCLQKAHRSLERGRVDWCQWLLRLCGLHSNPVNDLILINIPQENAHKISSHVTPALWARFLICKVRWSDYKVWPRRPLPPWSSVIAKSSCNHGREVTLWKLLVFLIEKEPCEGLRACVHQFLFFFQINIWHFVPLASFERPLLAQSVCPSQLHFSHGFSSQCALPRFYLSISHF